MQHASNPCSLLTRPDSISIFSQLFVIHPLYTFLMLVKVIGIVLVLSISRYKISRVGNVQMVSMVFAHLIVSVSLACCVHLGVPLLHSLESLRKHVLQAVTNSCKLIHP